MAGNLARGLPAIPDEAKFADFAPDADPITPGLLLDCDNIYPTAKGFRSYPSLTRYSRGALPSQCFGAYSALQGPSQITVAGTSDKLYELQGKVLADTGLTPTAIASPSRWRFDIYGRDLIAVNGVDRPFVKPFAGAWQNLGGTPPIASIVQATEFALFLIEPNSSIWHASLSDQIWTNSIATQTVSGPLNSTDGNITAAHQLRRGISLFKRKAFHYGSFGGPPLYWEFPPISFEVGAPSQEAVANIVDRHLWPATDDFYQFDGQSLQRIPNNLKEWFFSELDQTRDYQISARWDQKRSLVFWHFPSLSAPADLLDSWVCLDLRTGRWSRGHETIEAAVFSVVQTGALTYADFVETFQTYGSIAAGMRYGDLQDRNADSTGVFGSDHALYLYVGAPLSAFITTHDWGDRRNIYQVTRIVPQFSLTPEQGATCQVLNQRLPGSTPIPGLSATLAPDGWFDLINSERLQRFKITFNSEAEIIGAKADPSYAGEH